MGTLRLRAYVTADGEVIRRCKARKLCFEEVIKHRPPANLLAHCWAVVERRGEALVLPVWPLIRQMGEPRRMPTPLARFPTADAAIAYIVFRSLSCEE